MVHVLEYWEHNQYTHSCLCQLGLCIIYFKRYNTYHDTYEAILHMKQYSICINDTFCLVLDQKK